MSEVNVFMPQMGESVNEGTITKWHKRVGDKIEREEILYEISTDKVDTEIPAPTSGVLAKILVPEGAIAKVNTVVAVLNTEGAAAVAIPQATPAQESATKSETAQMSLASGPVSSPGVSESSEKIPLSEKPGERVIFSPLVRKMASEYNIDLSQVQGSGIGGRVTKSDVLAVLESGGVSERASGVQASQVSQIPQTAYLQEPAPVAAVSPQTSVSDGVRTERVPMTAMRKKIADHMVMSKQTSAHVTSVIEVDMQRIVDLREKWKDKFQEQYGFKLSFTPFFMAAAVEAIKAVPITNASVENDAILYKKDINLAMAVALDWGLIVPVIKNAGERNFVGLARELNSLAEKARTKKLSPDDVRGGTFSITNFGVFGTLIGQPIINQPQVAIMGVGAMVKKPVVIQDAIAIRTMCYVVLSYDHRVVDGSDGGKFLATVKRVLENWESPLL